MPIRQIDNGDYEFYYTITNDGNWWTCGCPDFNQPSHREGYKCKHIKDVIKEYGDKKNNVNVEETFDDDVIPF